MQVTKETGLKYQYKIWGIVLVLIHGSSKLTGAWTSCALVPVRVLAPTFHVSPTFDQCILYPSLRQHCLRSGASASFPSALASQITNTIVMCTPCYYYSFICGTLFYFPSHLITALLLSRKMHKVQVKPFVDWKVLPHLSCHCLGSEAEVSITFLSLWRNEYLIHSWNVYGIDNADHVLSIIGRELRIMHIESENYNHF